MKCNVGGMDMIARLVIGVVLLAIGLTVTMGLGLKIIVFVLAAIALITGIVRYCPLNALIGLNTCSGHGQQSHG